MPGDTAAATGAVTTRTPTGTPTEPGGRGRGGRERDHTRDGGILDAALDVLAELGFDGMTVDLVAARSGAARATVYRRWPTKVDLVLGALRRLGPDDGGPGQLPDTGTLRGDLLAATRTEAAQDQQRRVDVVAGLHAVAAREPRVAALLTTGGIDPWVEANRVLITRAVDRGEYRSVDVETLAQVIPAMCACRVAVQRLPVTRQYATALVDTVLLAAVRGAQPPAPDSPTAS